MQSLFRSYFSAQFLRFVAVGAFAALMHWGSRFLFNIYFSFSTAIVLAYGVGILVAFVLNKKFVFPLSGRPLSAELFYFVLVNLIAFPFVWIIAFALGEHVLVRWFEPAVARAMGHAVAIMVPLFVNFLVHKFITFRGS